MGFEPTIRGLVPYNDLAGERLKPLGHLSNILENQNIIANYDNLKKKSHYFLIIATSIYKFNFLL